MPHRYSLLPSFLSRRAPWLFGGLLGAAGLLLTAQPPQAGAVPPDPVRPSAARPLASDEDSVVYRLRGRVYDAFTAEPLPMASLWLRRAGLGTLSDEEGNFAFVLKMPPLDSTFTDTLEASAQTFRLRVQAVRFALPTADSVLRVVLARDSAVKTSQPVFVHTTRRGPRGTVQPLPPGQTTTTIATVPRRSFWQRLFGGR